jgi:hypothetical protein
LLFVCPFIVPKAEEEDREHFLLECKTLEENRKTQMVKLCEALEEAKEGGTRVIEQHELLMQIILDCTSCKINQLIPYTNQDLVQIERFYNPCTTLLCLFQSFT